MKSTKYSCQILMMLEFSRQIFERYSYQISLKYIQCEPSCSIRTDERTDGRTERRQTDMTKLTVAFLNFVTSPKNKLNLRTCVIFTRSSVF